MKKTLITAIALGVIGSGAAYYVWCSLQWKANAEQASASTSVESEGADYAQQPEAAAAPGSAALPSDSSTISPKVTDRAPAPTPVDPKSSMQHSGAVAVEARLGTKAVLTGRDTSVHMLLTARGAEDAVTNDAPVNLVLVLDRSGSMKGERIEHARAAAKFLVDELKDGDRVSVVSYNTEATTNQESVVVSAFNRGDIKTAIERIKVGGDTCISCGLATAQQQMLVGRSAAANFGTSTPVNRVVVLSDGKATAGVRDSFSLSTQAQGIRELGASVTTIGVGLDYNEELMSSMALKANGNHHFVEHPSALGTTLASEISTLRRVVARSALASLHLSPGVRLVKVFDRESSVTTTGTNVDLGDISAGAEATVLVELAVSPTFLEGIQPVATVGISYETASTRTLEQTQDTLEVAVTSDIARVQNGRDVEVEARVEQANIREALQLANAQIRAGNVDEARRIVRVQQESTNTWANKDKKRKESPRARRSLDALNRVDQSLKPSAMGSAGGAKRAAKASEADAFDLAL